MTTEADRRGALEAVERIVNRGEPDAVGETLVVLRRLYRQVAIRDGRLQIAHASVEDRLFLERVELLISHHSR